MERPIALITGATSGLGAEFAQQLARSQHDLVLVARNTGRLEAKAVRLRQDFGIQVEVLPADLVTDSGVEHVRARLMESTRPVSVLVNNAGFGLKRQFEENTIADEDEQLRILARTPMDLMYAALTVMLERKQGRIINVASVAGFIPRGSYGAAKAWVISFSRFASLRYRPRGVSVTAICPGLVHTEFHQRMRADVSRSPKWMWLEPELVVTEALAASAAGKAICIPSRRYKVLVTLSKLLPDRLAAAAGNRGR